MNKERREEIYKQFQPCCGVAPEITIFEPQVNANGEVYDDMQGIDIRCPKCRAQLYIKTYERGDSAFENIIKQAVKEWNVSKKFILPFEIITNIKGDK